VVGHAGHGDVLAGGLAAGGQGDVEEFGGAVRVLVEQLVEVTHAVEKEVGRVSRLIARYWRIMGV
jgi:hypothetical protein